MAGPGVTASGSSSETIIQLRSVTVDDRLEQTHRLYQRAVFGGDAGALVEAERLLSAIEAELALARGRVIHARFLDATSQSQTAPADVSDELTLFDRAFELYQCLGDVRGEPKHNSGSAPSTRSSGTMMPLPFLRSSEPATSPPKHTTR